MRTQPLELTEVERNELEYRVRSRRVRAEEARVARLILLLADGETYAEIARRLSCSPTFIAQWKKRFLAERLAGLYPRYQGRKAKVLSPAMEAKILAWTRKKPTDGSTHWSTRRLAKALGVHHMMVARTWQRAGLQPHRMQRYVASPDPDFEKKAADIIGLYLKPPQHAAASWLNQVELWFSKIERDVIARGIFTSVRDLAHTIMGYIRRYNRAPKPIKWRYRDPSRRIPAMTSTVTVH